MRKRTTILPKRRARRPSTTERVVGGGLLLLLAVIATLFVRAGARAGPVGLPEPTLDAPGSPLPLTSPGGWPRGEIEHYPVADLFEKINGKADAYVALDVVDLTFASYAKPDDPEQYVDAYLYDMAEALNAFGIYRGQRGTGEESLAIGDEGAGAGTAIFARKGRYYLEVVGSGPTVAEQARALAGAIAAGLPAAEVPAVDPPYFPAAGRAGVGYARRNALGMESLTDAFVARYEGGVQVVVARCVDAAAAEPAASEARENFTFLGTPALFAVRGRHVVGVVGAASAEARQARLDAVLGRLGEGR